MGATITLAKQHATGLVQHINDVVREKAGLYHCFGCSAEMIAVKGKAKKREHHFRHKVDTNCAGGRDKALHDYAVQVLMENIEVTVSKKLQIGYSNPRKEVSFHAKRSDVTVTYENEDVHFEVFVTHDLSQEKVSIYKANKIKCVLINLSDPVWLTASPNAIKEAILFQHRNKKLIYWKDASIPMSEEFNLKSNLMGVVATIGIAYLIKKILSKKSSR